jgi:thiol-disulfide isomerase/thioredoxin
VRPGRIEPEPIEFQIFKIEESTMRLRSLLALMTCLVLTSAAFAQRETLKVGSKAPGLDVEEWVKGEEVTIEDGTVYVVEFWATWCGPCRASIPHLTHLQKEYGDQGLVVIGISSDDDEAETVRKFVERQGSKMDYTVAIDRRKSTKRAWFDAAGRRGIPSAFVVDKTGKIAWIGNPHPKSDGPEMERIIEKVLRGRYDPRLQEAAQPLIEGAERARATRTWRMAEEYYTRVIDLDPTVFAEVALEYFEMLLVDQANRQKAYEYARVNLMQGHFVDDPGALQMLAEKIAFGPELSEDQRDLGVALEAAQMAMDQDEKNPELMATLARVHFKRGEIEQAIEIQEAAWLKVKPKYKEIFKRALDTYKHEQLRTASAQ